jgi:hypothetical protein
MKKYLCNLLILTLALTSSLQAKHDDKGAGKSDKKEARENKNDDRKNKDDKEKSTDNNGQEKHVITIVEKQVIHDYVVVYQQKEKVKSLPPGLAKKVARGEALPPGWQKKIVRGEVLPTVVYTEASPVPRAILINLPAQPEGTRLVVLDGKILRVAAATRTILDVIDIR